MRTLSSALITLLGAILCTEVASGQITTIILSNNTDTAFRLLWTDSKTTQTIEFPLDAALPEALKNARVSQCELYIVENRTPGEKVKGQDVAVLDGTEQIGELHIGKQDTGSSYRTPLQPTSCDPRKKTLKLTLQSKSPNTNRQYYGGGGTPAANPAANRPRLIVTYDAPTPAHTGDMTDWAYSNPTSFFSSLLWKGASGETLLANPVSYDGAVYLVAACSTGRCLYRVAGAGNVASWPLGFNVIAKSFAFVTEWGRLEIVTKGAIGSCDLTALPSPKSGDKLTCKSTSDENIAVNSAETPAMGPDGSLYFKNVEADGSIVAYNPSLQEIWRSKPKLTKVSPIALNASGRYAYVLADVDVKNDHPRLLLCIDTATGEIVRNEIGYKNTENNVVNPGLQEFFKPAVVSKEVNGRSVDYVFLAANTKDDTPLSPSPSPPTAAKGLLQLVSFTPGARSGLDPTYSLVWSQEGKKITAGPVPSVDGNSLFVAWQDEQVSRYSWYNTQTGAYKWEDLEFKKEKLGTWTGVTTLLVDGGGSVYRDVVYQDGQRALWVVLGRSGISVGPKTLQFATDGSLIGYTENELSDYSPKSGPSISPKSFETNTIYSADTVTVPSPPNTVTVPSNPGIKSGDQVILKGTEIHFPPNFTWPVGATLKVQSVQ